jgi:hypothetical protein
LSLNKVAFLRSVGAFAAASYIFLHAMAAGEYVELLPGLVMPSKIAMMLGAVGFYGAIFLAVEAFIEPEKKPH